MAKKTSELVLLFHKKTIKLVFLLPIIGQKSMRVLIYVFDLILSCSLHTSATSSSSSEIAYVLVFFFIYFILVAPLSRNMLCFVNSVNISVLTFIALLIINYYKLLLELQGAHFDPLSILSTFLSKKIPNKLNCFFVFVAVVWVLAVQIVLLFLNTS